jgi:hypothetical protein
MDGLAQGDQPQVGQFQRLANLQGRAQVTEMDRIEGPAQEPDHVGVSCLRVSSHPCP